MENITSVKSIGITKAMKEIGWINGSWGSTSELQLALADRGLIFGDGIFETILIRNDQPKLLKLHLDRWSKSASILGMAPPPKKEWLEGLIKEAINKATLSNGYGALRLNWSR